MPDQNSSHSPHQERLDRIIADYLEAAEAGRAPDRQEILAQNPQLAGELEAFFADHDRMNELAQPIALAERSPSGDEAGSAAADTDAPTLPPNVTHRTESATLPPTRASGIESAERAAADAGTEIVLPPGTTIRYFGDYELLEEIARGGMGVVYKARQVSLNRIVALKMILAGQLAGEEDVKRFHAEAEAAANLDHPGIVPIFEVGQHEGQHYFSMGYIEGQSLAELLRDGPLAPCESAELLCKVAEAVQYAHEHGVIHRDLKPANVLLQKDEGGRRKDEEKRKPHHSPAPDLRPTACSLQPKITDFGLAKRVEGGSDLTASGQVLGTPGYMPPEQASGKLEQVGPVSDVYALGAILYACVTGRPPFQADNPLDTLLQVLDREPVSPRQLNHNVSRDLETICLKCLEKESGRRYDAAQSLADELGRYLNNEPILARPMGRPGRLIKWAKRRPVVAALSAAVVTLLWAIAVISPLVAVAQARLRREGEAGQQHALAAESRATEQRDKACSAEREARAQSDAAEKARDAEQQQRLLAEQRQARLQRYLYATRLNLAQEHINSGYVQHARAVLDRLRPKQGELDLRDFAWRYLDGICQASAQAHTLTVNPVRVRGQRNPENLPVGGVHAAIFSPDGRFLATAGIADAIKLWDMRSHKVVKRLTPVAGLAMGFCRAIAFSPDGQSLAAAQNKTIVLWDASAGTQKAVIDASGEVFHVAFAPDGQSLAGGDREGRLCLWDMPSRKKRWDVQAHDGPISGLAFSPDGHLLVSGGFDESLVFSRAKNGQEADTAIKHAGRIRGLAFSPDGTTLLSGTMDGWIKLWDVQARTVQQAIPSGHGPVWSVAFSPDGQQFAAACANPQRGFGAPGTAVVWDAETLRPVAVLHGHSDVVTCVCFAPDGKLLATGSDDGTVKFWTLAQRQLTFSLGSDYANEVALDPWGNRVAIAATQQIHLWNVDQAVKQGEFKPPLPFVKWLSWSPTAEALAIGSFDKVVLCPADAPENACVLEGVNGPGAFSDDGRLVAACDRQGVQLFDAASGRRLRSLAFPPGTPAMAFALSLSPRGHYAVAAVMATSVKRRAVPARSPQRKSWLPVCATTLLLWDARAGRPLRSLEGHPAQVFCLAWAPDEQTLASGGFDGTVVLWDVPQGHQRASIRHSARITAVAFSHDGRTLATASDDATIVLWDPVIGEKRITLKLRAGQKPGTSGTLDVKSLAFATNDQSLVAVSAGREPAVWRWECCGGQRQPVEFPTGRPRPTKR